MSKRCLSDREEAREIQEKLKKLLLDRLPDCGLFQTNIEGVVAARREECNVPGKCFYMPMIALVVQGVKRSVVGASEVTYGQGDSLIVGMEVPATFYVVEASHDQPYLAISLQLDRYMISQLVNEFPSLTNTETSNNRRSIVTYQTTPELLDAFLRLAKLSGDAEQAKLLAPLVIREIHYRLLLSHHGNWLRSICTTGTLNNQIAQAVSWLRQNFMQPMKVENLAQSVGLSASAFYHHFRVMTSVSPLQFQKRLRLHEAQRLLITGAKDITNTALAVGYESPAQFSREYKRLFGLSPSLDIKGTRQQTLA